MRTNRRADLNTMHFAFRKAAAADEAAIRLLLEEARLPSESLGTHRTKFFLAEQDGVIIGVAGFEYYGDDALLRSVAIKAHLRNSGLGSMLVDNMLSFAKERRVRDVVLLTETAAAFFQRKGFAVIERSLIDNDALKHSSEFVSACPSSATAMIIHIR
jgi:amino-acid N-acetyltransferase